MSQFNDLPRLEKPMNDETIVTFERTIRENQALRKTLQDLVDKVEQYAESGCIEAYVNLSDDDLSTAVDNARTELEKLKPNGGSNG